MYDSAKLLIEAQERLSIVNSFLTIEQQAEVEKELQEITAHYINKSKRDIFNVEDIDLDLPTE